MTDIEPTTRPSAAVRADARRRLAPGSFAQTLQLIAQRVGGEVVFLPGDRVTLTGTPGEVGQLLAAIKSTGRLVSSTTPTPFGSEARVLVNVRLAPPVQGHLVRQAAPRRQLSRRALWFIAAAVVALIAGLAWAVYVAVTALLANLPAVLVVVVIAVAALVLVGKSTGGGGTFSGTFKGRVD